MIKFTAVVTASDTQAISRLREKRNSQGAVAMTEDEHQDLLELEREQAELAHAKWAAGRTAVYLRQVVEAGGDFGKGGNRFIRAAVVPYRESTLEAALTLAAQPEWVDGQLNTLRVKARHMGAARAHLATLVVKMIEREVGNGY